MPATSATQLVQFFSQFEELELAVLIGSRANGHAHAASDWDFAIQWNKSIPPLDALGLSESLRLQLARQLDTSPELIDLINIPTARLAMRAVITDEGALLKGDNTLAWSHLLLRTWAELEEFEWERQHAA